MATQINPANVADFTFSMGKDDKKQELRVTGFTGSEGLNELFYFRVELCTDDPDIDIAKAPGKACLLQFAAEGGRRNVNGIVRSFRRMGWATDETSYFVAEIVPLHWVMTRRIGFWIHQEHNTPDMSVPGIIKQVFADSSLPDDFFRFALEREYAKRDFVVRYRESEYDFIARLCEDEGIHFFFEHTVDGHKMVFADSPVAHMPANVTLGKDADAALAELPFRDASGLVAERSHVYHVDERHELVIGAAELDDFNFERVAAPMWTRLQAEDNFGMFDSDFPGKFEEKAQGEVYTKLRLEEYQCGKRTLEMATSARHLAPGYRFSLVEHQVESLNGSYLVTRITHRATQPQSGDEDLAGADQVVGYQADLRVIPADVPYRPARKTPKPRVSGSQTAIVVGPREEEIYVDKYGRVKVQFHWDPQMNYNERSSCWIRVSQVWSGGEYGVLFHPRVGHEVIVSFLEGDPDRPIITGRVHNGDLMPVFNVPDNKMVSGIWSQSTKGGGGCHALVFDDTKDKEMAYLHSQKDLELTAERDYSRRCGRDMDTIIEGSRFELIKEYHQSEVRLDHDEIIGGNKSQQVKGSVGESFGSHAETTGAYSLKAGKGGVVIEADSMITLKVGGNFISIHGGGVDIVGDVVNINSGGSAGNGCGAALGEFIDVYQAEYAEPPGYDVVYTPENPETTDALQTTFIGKQQTEQTATPTSWIELEMVDEAGQPWPGEAYEITTPDGQVIKGALDATGQARASVPLAGDCQIRFPRLDMEAWQRAT